jgi:hypothetical protein
MLSGLDAEVRAPETKPPAGTAVAPVVGRYCPGLAHMPYHIDRYVGSA